MAVYEILLRGKEDGSLSGAHIIKFESDGADAAGNPRYKVGDAKPLNLETLAQYVGEQFASALVDTAEYQKLKTEVEELREQLRKLRGTPQFSARKLLDVLAASADYMQKISAATAASPDALAFYQRLLTRQENDPVVVDSPVFLAALAALRDALQNDQRVAEIFRAVNIDIAVDPIAYIDPSA